MTSGETQAIHTHKKALNKSVFVPAFAIVGGAAVLGLVDNALLTSIANKIFAWTLSEFAWLYELASMAALLLIVVLCFSRLGKVRFGGQEAKSQYSFASWFAMTLTGGIATGLITYGVNEPLVYYGNVWGELKGVGLEPFTEDAAFFAMGRVFYHWTFVPYAMYAMSGLIIAYMYFNRKEEMSVSASLIPIFGKKVTQGVWRVIIDTLCILAIALGLSASLGAGLSLIGTGLEYSYGIKQGPLVWLFLVAIITATFTVASVKGVAKGIKWLADLTSKIFYFLLIFLFIAGPTIYCLNLMNVGIGMWGDHFWTWGMDPGLVNGTALVTWWTMYSWSIWIAYAPLMGIFFAMIAYGRTIREFLTVNWILPSVFGMLWLTVWGGTALNWQASGKANIVEAINASGATAGLWAFIDALPLSAMLVPVIMITLICGFATTADTMATSISVVCTKEAKFDEEPANWLKILWGLAIGTIAGVMVAFGGGVQGIDGVKFLAAAGGFAVLFIFILQMVSVIKALFVDEIVE